MRIAFALILAVVLGGSVDRNELGQKKYKVPTGATETATFIFPKGGLRLSVFSGDYQYYRTMKGDECQLSQKLIDYSAGIGRNTKEKPIKIEAGKKVEILGFTMKQTYGGYNSQLYSSCINVIEFTPKANATYNITQIPDGNNPVRSCSMDVKEVSTGRTPEDMKVLPVPNCEF
ncbi:hypothetical protein EEB18_006400 [Sphingopyxis sp. OPL5]|jgi:hypothetical protein|uniref:hypothetical protein n=1 Tax=Sphingopyxis sp. OPL5 TaxID=2486273 RepID=UPI00164ED7AC|nr:hypothetical protein [Sphingopyxis sp. OPL5]QNO28575.1 hypothetical protein EEB18_006400 [Sphingopyxis sp. OPL5]